MSKKILIVGGVAGGASTAARLRRLDESAEIIMFEKGNYISFANCGLPYYIGETIKQRDSLLLQTPEAFNARFNVDVRIRNKVIDIDRENQTVTVVWTAISAIKSATTSWCCHPVQRRLDRQFPALMRPTFLRFGIFPIPIKLRHLSTSNGRDAQLSSAAASSALKWLKTCQSAACM